MANDLPLGLVVSHGATAHRRSVTGIVLLTAPRQTAGDIDVSVGTAVVCVRQSGLHREDAIAQ
jgi:hypothetical protein